MSKESEAALGFQPLPAAVGPYEILNVLGRGGMGVVYHGRDRQTGRSLAVKTLDRARESHVAGIRREIQTLASLSHPGVVHIEAHGVSGGVPWYAMELLTGTTLREQIRRARQRKPPNLRSTDTRSDLTQTASPLELQPAVETSPRVTRSGADWPELLVTVHGVCEVLVHLHERGVVHRDLKPENIFVRDDGTLVLVDFGISARFGGSEGREELQLPVATGTVAYMAPEQIQRQFVDARADMYALGCILYECFSGDPPFTGDAGAVLGAHLKQQVLPLSMLFDGVPPEIDRLVVSLLEKDTRQRPGYADDVARVIRRALPERGLPALASTQPYVYRPAFVGRRALLRELRESLAELARDCKGSCVFLGGESGVGKTRLAMELAREAAALGARVVLSRCSRLGLGEGAPSAEAPLQAFAPLLTEIADCCSAAGSQETQRILGQGGRALADYVSALRDAPGFAELPASAGQSPGEAREQVFAGVVAALRAFAERRPLLLVIDDLQWLDELSLGALAALLGAELAESGIMILGTYRLEDVPPPVQDVIRSGRSRHVELTRFGLGEVSALVRDLLGLEQSPLNLVAALQRRCGGNPFFVIEYLRAAIADGRLRRLDGRWCFGDAGELFNLDEGAFGIPYSITKLFVHRFRNLDDASRRLLQAAAVLGREIEPELLALAADTSQEVVGERVLLLCQRQMLEDAEQDKLRFAHEAIRESAYHSIELGQRVELHLRIAQALEPRCADDPRLLRVTAHHFAQAGMGGRARHHYSRAAQFAFERHANVEAVACIAAALREQEGAADAESSSPMLLERLGDLHSLTAKFDEARSAYERAMVQPARLERTVIARLHRKLGKTWETHHDHLRARAAYDEAHRALTAGESDAPRDAGWWSELIQVSLERLWVCYWLNQIDEMSDLAASVRELTERHGSAFQRARFLQILVMLETRRERYLISEATLTLAREAREVAQVLAPPDRAALEFVHFFALVLHGSLEEAERCGLDVLQWAKRAGAQTLRARCLTYLMLVARRRDQIDEVERLSAQCASASSSARMGEYQGALKANLAWAAWRRERHATAKLLGNEALQAWQGVKVPYPLQWLARFPLLAMAVSEADLTLAREHTQRLLDPEQQRLPGALTDALCSASSEGAREAPHVQLERLAQALHCARALRYL